MNVNLFQSAVVCIAVVAACISEISAKTPPTVTAAEISKLPKSVNSIGMNFKSIPAGTFMMGYSSTLYGKVFHQVTLKKPFKLGIYEVTQAQYEKVTGVKPSKFKVADNPVETLTWDHAVDFCRKLSELPAEKDAGNVYRLPTEAEWEYACRAGTTTKYSFGDDESELRDHAWYSENFGGKTHPVGSKKPNAWGLYDMHGNVWEWCQDWLGGYPSGMVRDPTGPASGSAHQYRITGPLRVYRGGSWFDLAEFCRSASRCRFGPSHRFECMGFRVCLSPSGK